MRWLRRSATVALRSLGADDRLPRSPLPLRARRATSCVAAAARGGGRADAQRRARREIQRRRGRARRAPRGGLRQRSAATPTPRPASTTRRRRRSPSSAPTRRCGRSARPGSTSTATPPRRDDQRRAFAARSRSPRELGLPIVIHVRDPEGESAAIDEIFATLDARGRRRHGDPPLLLGAAAGRATRPSAAGTARSPATSPTRTPRTLRVAAAKVPGRPASWSRPTRPSSRRSRVRGKRNEPANVVATARGGRRGARRLATRSFERTVEANAARALRLVARAVVRLGQNFLADPNLLDAIVRDAGRRAGRRRARGRGGGGGADASGSPRAPPTSTRSRSTAGWSRRWQPIAALPNVSCTGATR